jgi:hypothetical protein
MELSVDPKPGKPAKKASEQTGPPWFVQGAAAPIERSRTTIPRRISWC